MALARWRDAMCPFGISTRVVSRAQSG
jgi:hypothetical protein